MIRAPGLNTLMNLSQTVKQLYEGRNAFQELVASEISRKAPTAPLKLREVSSSYLWVRACHQALAKVTAALALSDQSRAQKGLRELHQLDHLLRALHVVDAIGPPLLWRIMHTRVIKQFETSLLGCLKKGLVSPSGVGLPSRTMLQVSVEKSVRELLQEEHRSREEYLKRLERGTAGGEPLVLTEEDTSWIPEQLRKQLPRKGFQLSMKSRMTVVPNTKALLIVQTFCQNPKTRRRVFEAYYGGIGHAQHEALLKLLRARQTLAEKLGFRSWAHYDLRDLEKSTPRGVRELLDSCWKELLLQMNPIHKKMRELASSSGVGTERGELEHTDEVFFKGLVLNQQRYWELFEYLPAGRILPLLLEIIGKVLHVNFQLIERDPDNGWRNSVNIYKVFDTSHKQTAAVPLGFVYMDQVTSRNSPSPNAFATLMCPGHVYVNLNFPARSMKRVKLLLPSQAQTIAHEMGHAVHLLCLGQSANDLHEMPLDVIELPSTLLEVVASDPGIVSQYSRHHATNDTAPHEVVKAGLTDPYDFMASLQRHSVVTGLHDPEEFDPFRSSEEDLREKSVELWQRYSLVAANHRFSPLGQEAGMSIAEGPSQIAYLLCRLRVDSVLAGAGNISSSKKKDLASHWVSPEFASAVRARLLDRRFEPGRKLAMLPHLAQITGFAKGETPPHPLPPMQPAKDFFERLARSHSVTPAVRQGRPQA